MKPWRQRRLSIRGGLLLLWSATGVLLLLALRQPPPRTFSLEPPPSGPRVVRSLAIEIPAWTGPRTQILLHGVDGPASLVLLLKPNRDLGQGGGRVWLEQGGRPLAELAVDAARSRHEVLLEQTTTRGPWLAPEPIDVRCERYFARPEAAAVGVRLLEIMVRPLPAWRLGRAMWLTFVLAIATSLLLRLDRRLFKRRTGEGVRVLVPGSVAALGLAGWAYHDPYGLAWHLPPLPTAVGLVAAAILLFHRRWSRGPCPAPRHSAWPSLAAFAAGQAAFVAIDAPWPGALAVTLGLVLLPKEGNRTGGPAGTRSRRVALVALLLVTAFGLRLHRIREIPQGMWRDEARHALVALKILEDPEYRPLYVAQRHPKINLPGLGFFLFVPGLLAFGIEPWSLRIVTAVAGALTVLPAYGLARRLLGEGPAALAGLFVATSSWHLTLSRYAFPAVFDTLFTTTALWLTTVAAGSHSGRARCGRLFAAGVLLGLATQTYHTGRLAPVLGAVLMLFLLRPHEEGRRSWSAWGAGLLLALLPVGLWTLRHPGQVGDRVGEVALLSRAPARAEAPLTAVDQSLLGHLLMFNVRGDEDGHHNLPGRPMLDLLTGLGFLAGIGVLARRREEAGARFLLSALALGVLPSLLAIDGPNGLRATAAVIPACLIAAGGWATLLSSGRGPTRSPRGRAPIVLLASGVAGLNAYAYFVERPLHPRVWRVMYPVETALGVHLRSIAAHEPKVRVFLPASSTRESVLQYLTHGIPFETFARNETSTPVREGDVFLGAGPDGEEVMPSLRPPLRLVPVFAGPHLPGTTVPTFVAYRARGPSS